MSSDLPRLNEKLNRRDQVCRGCNRRGDKFKRKNHFTRVTSSYIQRLNQSKLFSFQFNKGDFLCFNCRVNFRLKCDTSEQRVSRGEVQVVQSTSLSPTLIFRNSTRNNFTRSGQLGVHSDATVTKSQPITVSPSITFRCSTRNKRKPRKFSPSEKRVQGGEHPFVSSQSTFMSPTLTFWNSNRKKRNLSKSDAGQSHIIQSDTLVVVAMLTYFFFIIFQVSIKMKSVHESLQTRKMESGPIFCFNQLHLQL